MKPTLASQSSFAILALCLCQSCTISTGTTTTYIQSNVYLVEGRAKALEGDWKGAARIWNQLAGLSTDNISGKAAYNMVVACEMLDRRDLAIKWAKKTMAVYDSPTAKKRALAYLHKVNNAFIDKRKEPAVASVKN